MSIPTIDQIKPSPKVGCISGAIAVANAFVTSLATAAAPVNLTGAGLTGAIGAAAMTLPRTVSVTTAAHAASYIIGAPIVVTGLDIAGNTITENLTLTQAGGGETVVGLKGFTQIANIAIPAMNDTLGSWTFGTRDIELGGGCRQIVVGTANDLHITNSLDGTQVTIPKNIVTASPVLPIAASKVWGDAASLASDIMILF